MTGVQTCALPIYLRAHIQTGRQALEAYQRSHIDALAADGHKWLLGPEGCGILYISRKLQEQVEPVEFGWTNAASYSDYSSRDLTPWNDARRYECGTLNTIGCYGLRASLDFILGIGVERIAPVVQSLADRIAGGARAKAYEMLGERTPETGAGIVSFRRADVDGRALCSNLRAKGIIAVLRAGWVRMSPHFYLLPEEIERVVELLP